MCVCDACKRAGLCESVSESYWLRILIGNDHLVQWLVTNIPSYVANDLDLM